MTDSGDNPAYDRAIELLFTDPAASLAEFDRAAAEQPWRARIHTNKSKALLALGRNIEAIEVARRAWSGDSNDAYVGTGLVTALFESGEYDEIVELSRRVEALEGIEEDQERFVHSARCWALMRSDPTTALAETQHARLRWPEDAEVLAAHACALGALCRWDEALEWIDRSIERAPGDERLSLRRQKIEGARDAAEEAIAQLRSDAEADPPDADAWRMLGLGLARFARLEDALVAFDKAHEIDPDPGEAQHADDAEDTDEIEVAPLVQDAMMVEATIRSWLMVGQDGPIG